MLLALVGMLAVGVPAGSATAATRAVSTRAVSRAADTTAARTGHGYRHGLIGRVVDATHRHEAATPSVVQNLHYDGGTSDAGYTSPVGVTTGSPRVYLVYWGSQWGSAGVDSNGYTTLSGDPSGIAAVQQAFFAGLGTGGELWSGVMTQYCEGVTPGATTCPAVSARVGYPTGGALAGVWEDTASAAPAGASGHAIAAEAVAAATHFGNLTPTANRSVQYVIVSPTGTDPDGWLNPISGYCAWHDDTADSSLGGGAASSPDGTLAFTNMPYLPDVGASCGAGFVNTPGSDDGVTIVGGHEYAETVTDQFPAGGWIDLSGQENGDKCAWVSSGVGASQDISLTTGSFAVQTTWSNDSNSGLGACAVAHPIGSSVGPTITTVNAATFASSLKQTFTVKATGGTATAVAEAGALPPGVTFVPGLGHGTLVGTAPIGSEGVYPITMTATSSIATTTQPFTLTVVPKRKFTSAKVVTFALGNPGTFTVTTVGSFGKTTAGLPRLPVITEVGLLPAGVTLADNGDGTAVLSGTPTVVGKFRITITATAPVGAVLRQTFTLTVI